MNDKGLELLKKRYQEWKEKMINYSEKKAKIINLQSELNEMENNEEIKKYLLKKEEFNCLNNDICKFRRSGLTQNEDEILINLGTNYDTNRIYVCVGEYTDEFVKNFVDNRYLGSKLGNDKFLPINSEDGVYRIYLDIESNTKVIVNKYTQMTDFEKENIVLYSGEENPIDFYNKVRLIFFRNCVDNTQEEAIAKILELKK